jgi:hypothetical protein
MIHVALVGFLILKSKQIIHITCFNLFICHFSWVESMKALPRTNNIYQIGSSRIFVNILCSRPPKVAFLETLLQKMY